MLVKTALEAGYITCQTCGKLSAIDVVKCPLCYRNLAPRQLKSLQNTLAWLCTAILLYLPANFLPIMFTQQFSQYYSATIVGGVIDLWQQQAYFIAIVIFMASIVVPIIKIVILLWLVVSVKYYREHHQKQRSIMYRLTEIVGRWSMIDVFVVAILVALFQLGGVITIIPGPAALAFAGVVATTMFAAKSFDSRLIWDHVNTEGKQH
ncbi:paraquat-inducible protein A [Algibacillus agarilyticus]|uniref:paraquat-inducible protein A n=1 Tax=Algibacillus agarilyticus TaxID=2234133 RepID=UPI000DD0E4A5|nr:paraquat-inducible protein A [Algibacillus agarilyticus]